MLKRQISVTLIVILMPNLLCFAQEVDKQSFLSAQELQTEKTNPKPSPVVNKPDVTPFIFGPIQSIKLSPEMNAWAVQIMSKGGLTGSGRGNLIVTSQGSLTWDGAENPCNVKLTEGVLGALTQVVFSTNGSSWRGITSGICTDCYITSIVLQRREGDGTERVYSAYWDDTSKGNISEEVKKIYETFMAYRACKR